MTDLWTPETARVVSAQMDRESDAPKDVLDIATSSRVLTIADGRIRINVDNHTIVVDDQRAVTAPLKQLQVLAVLASQPDRLVTFSELSERVWGDPDIHLTSQAPMVTLSGARRKLGEELGDHKSGAIRTRRGFGHVAVSSLSGEHTISYTDESLIYRFADDRIEVNMSDYTVMCDARMREMTPRQFGLLAELAQRPGRVISLSSLATRLWGESNHNTLSNVYVGISEVRGSLGAEFSDTRIGAIRTKPGVGYYAARSLVKGASGLGS